MNLKYEAGADNGRNAAMIYLKSHTGRQVQDEIKRRQDADVSADDYALGYQIAFIDTLMARREYARNT